MAKLPSDSEVRTAFREIFPAAASVDDEVGESISRLLDGSTIHVDRPTDAPRVMHAVLAAFPPTRTSSHAQPNQTQDMDLDRVQRALEEHLDVADLGPRASVIEAEVQRWREEREKEAQSQRLSQGACACLRLIWGRSISTSRI